jgi:spermidine/putrescine transport system substrate-binding protein
MKTLFRLLALSLAIVLCLPMLAACGKKENGQVTLRVYNWGDYIDPDVLKAFSDANPDIKIVYDTFDSNEAMLAKLDGGAEYDILFPSDYMVEKLVKDGKLAELDLSKLPNLKNIDDKFRNLAFDPKNAHSVPYTWGTLGILYNTSTVKGTVDSWGVLFDKTNKGKVIMYDSVRDSIAVALKYLGYSGNDRDEAHLNEAGALLRQQKADKIVKAYMTDTIKEAMISGTASYGVVYSGDAVLCMDENEDLEYVVPKEGSNYFVDNIVVMKSSKSKEAAYRFINYLLDANVAAKNCEYIGYSSPNRAAIEVMGEAYANIGPHNPPAQILALCEVFVDLGDAAALYNRVWESVKLQ